MSKYEVVIIGGGPAGLSAAQVLARGGKRVLLIEKNQRIGPKICAGGLTSQIFSLGLHIELTDRQFFSFNVHCFNKLIEIKDKRLLLATINRSRLGQWMLGQIPGGVEIFTDSNVTEIRETSLLLDNDREILFDYLIGADGSLSLVRKYLNLPIKKILITLQCNIAKKFETLQIFFNPNTIGPGYFWIFPHKDYTSFGVVTDSRAGRVKNLLENFKIWLEKNGINFNEGNLQSHPINFDFKGFHFGNVFLAGDAAGLASGLTGEGISQAILSGREIAQKILDPSYDTPLIKKILRRKTIEETLGMALIFKVLKSKKLTDFFFKKWFLKSW